MEMMIWNIALSATVAIMGFLFKGKIDELDRLGILLNKTREEVAKEYVTKAEVHTDINRVLDRLDRLESKLDTVIKGSQSAQR
jgi:Tfp pilus assembly protein PilO